MGPSSSTILEEGTVIPSFNSKCSVFQWVTTLESALGTSTLKSRTQSIEPGSTFDEYGGRISVVMFFMPTGQQSSGVASRAFQQMQ